MDHAGAFTGQIDDSSINKIGGVAVSDARLWIERVLIVRWWCLDRLRASCVLALLIEVAFGGGRGCWQILAYCFG